MIQISKGDIVVEPLELLIRFFARVIGRILGDTTPMDSASQWGWIDWLWLFVVLSLLGYLIRHFWCRNANRTQQQAR